MHKRGVDEDVCNAGGTAGRRLSVPEYHIKCDVPGLFCVHSSEQQQNAETERAKFIWPGLYMHFGMGNVVRRDPLAGGFLMTCAPSGATNERPSATDRSWRFLDSG